MLSKNNVLFVGGPIELIGGESDYDSAVHYLSMFDKVVIGNNNVNSLDTVYKIIKMAKVIKPDMEFFVFHGFPISSGDGFITWQNNYTVWKTAFPAVDNVIDGFFINNFDLNYVDTATRANQNGAVSLLHTDGFKVFVGSNDLSKSVGEIRNEVSPVIGTDNSFIDLVLIENYYLHKDALGDDESKASRLGRLEYAKNLKTTNGKYLDFVVEIGAKTSSEISSKVWYEVREEMSVYGINYLAINKVDYSVNDSFYWLTNKANSEELYPGPEYALLYGYVKPSVFEEAISKIILDYSRTDIELNDKFYDNSKGKITLEIDPYGYWSVPLAASANVEGTKYNVIVSSGYNNVKKEITIVANNSYDFGGF